MDEDYLEKLRKSMKDKRPHVLVGWGIGLILCIIAAYALIGASSHASEQFVINDMGKVSGPGENLNSQESDIVIAVHVAGAVENAGVFELPQGARAGEAIDAAGGFLENADKDALNLARVLNDGEQLFIPEKGEDGAFDSTEQNPIRLNNTSAHSSKVNLNTASAEELEALPGIGPALAKRIVEYRKREGSFASVQDLKKVSGIGVKKLEALEDLVMV